MIKKLLNAPRRLLEFFGMKFIQLNNYISLRKLNASIKHQKNKEIKEKIKQQKQHEKFIKSQRLVMRCESPASFIIALDNKLYTISINDEGVEVLEALTQNEVTNESLVVSLLMEAHKHG